ncbi:MAG: thioredoxin fold domain-containing protein [Campylobacterales bacterium]|nr:thioredoxin fold domain-containing protein [Campylobacterales bacterium]
MKKLFLSFLLFVGMLYGDVKFTDMFDAYDEAKAQKKLVLVMLSQEGCSGCEYMKNVVFHNKDVSKYLEEKYITVHLDIYQEPVPEELEHFATPTFYFLDEDENILKRLNGGENAKDFLNTLKSVEEAYKK